MPECAELCTFAAPSHSSGTFRVSGASYLIGTTLIMFQHRSEGEMMRLPLIALICLVANLATSQTPPPPQTARQALIEMFFGTAPNHLEKHLPDVTRKSLQKLDTGDGRSLLSEFSMLATQAKSGGANLQTFDTGPTIVSIDQLDKAAEHVEI